MVAIGGIADIVQHWHEMARSRMTQSGHPAGFLPDYEIVEVHQWIKFAPAI
jgi:hypothetical protein